MKEFLKNNGLSVAFWLLFLLCLVGQAVLGHVLERGGMAGRGPAGGVFRYVGGADFLKGVFGNWQAALLQLFTLVVFAVFLRQRGASHSRKSDDDGGEEDQGKASLLSRGRSLLYRNSLSLALFVLFAGSFGAFFFADLHVDAAERAKEGKAVLTGPQFLISPRFWFDILQTWQAEFFAMGAFLILSIFLRQDNSAESKPVWASDENTGDTNE